MRFWRWEGRSVRAALALLVAASCVLVSQRPSSAGQSCASDLDVTICIAASGDALSGFAPIEVTKDPNWGTLLVTWTPDGGREVEVITRYGPDPETKSYSFLWPTHKYLDAAGVLAVHSTRVGLTAAIDVTLQNGNTTDTHTEPADWKEFLPEPWTGSSPPVVAAVGDGPDGRPDANAPARSIVAANPALFLFLGDIYESGTPAELWNHFGMPSFDGPGTLWGALASRTQPTLGDHEASHVAAWRDYFRGRARFGSFRFGGVLFLNLDSTISFQPGSNQYELVERRLAEAPPCVVAYWHLPAIVNGEETGAEPIWQLLADGGGDLVLAGNIHTMAEYHPMTASFERGGHLVHLIAGSGGHFGGNAIDDPQGRVAWSLGKTPGAVFLTLNGAQNGGRADSIDWSFRDPGGASLRNGSVTCDDEEPAPPPPGPVVALDEFTRLVSEGWGSADNGGSWSIVEGSAASFVVNGTAGQIVTPGRDERAIVLASSAPTRDVDALVAVRRPFDEPGPDKPNVFALLRWGAKSAYRVGFQIDPNGAVSLRAETTEGVRLFWNVATGVVAQPGQVLVLRAQVRGADPTSVRARVWLQGTTEPAGWQAVATDATVGLQSDGRVGVATVEEGNGGSRILIERLEMRAA